MIATLSEVKTILGLSNTNFDDRIIVFMPIVEEKISTICRQYFISNIDLENEKYLGVNTLSFDNATNKILDSDSQLDCFISGNTIRIFNSVDNDGIYLIDTVASDGSYLTIDSDYATLIDESAAIEKWISIYKLTYPKALKIPYAQMISYRLSKNSLAANVKSEKIDDYAITYKDSDIIYGYPKDIIRSLQDYRKHYWDTRFIQTY